MKNEKRNVKLVRNTKSNEKVMKTLVKNMKPALISLADKQFAMQETILLPSFLRRFVIFSALTDKSDVT